MQETWEVVSIPGSGRSPEGGHSNPLSIHSWRVPWTEEPGRLWSMGSQRVRQSWSDLAHTHIKYEGHFLNLFIYFNCKLTTILWWFLPYIDMNQPQVYVCPPSQNPLPLPSPSHPSGLPQCTSFECPFSCTELGLVICFTYGHIPVSMRFFQIIPFFHSPTESKSLCLFCCLAYSVIITIFLNSIFMY